MHTAYPKTNGAYPIKFASRPYYKNSIIMISNSDDQFQILTDTQAVNLIESSPQLFDKSVALPFMFY